MMANNLLTRLQQSPVHIRKAVLIIATSGLMIVIASIWLLNLINTTRATTASQEPASAFALFENSFFRKNIHYTR